MRTSRIHRVALFVIFLAFVSVALVGLRSVVALLKFHTTPPPPAILRAEVKGSVTVERKSGGLNVTFVFENTGNCDATPTAEQLIVEGIPLITKPLRASLVAPGKKTSIFLRMGKDFPGKKTVAVQFGFNYTAPATGSLYTPGVTEGGSSSNIDVVVRDEVVR